MSVPWVTLIPCARDPAEQERLSDLLHALRHFEPHCPLVVAVNDGGDPGPFAARLAASGFPHHIIPNPRRDRGWGWAGGLTCGLQSALAWIHREVQPECVVRMDTDALPIGPFSREVRERVGSDERIGLAGRVVFLEQVDIRRLRRLMLPLSVWRRPRPHFRVGSPFTRGSREINLSLSRAARRDNWRSPVTQGGCYAVTRAFLTAMEAGGWWDDPLRFLHVQIPEDIMHSYLNRGLGLETADISDVVASHCEPLTGWHRFPEQGVRVIHPVKDMHGTSQENEMRAFFRKHRQTAGRNASEG
jgi:hypothetical protein